MQACTGTQLQCILIQQTDHFVLPPTRPPSLAGLGAVVTGIVPKMAIRFASFERYKAWLTPVNGTASGPGIFVGEDTLTAVLL